MRLTFGDYFFGLPIYPLTFFAKYRYFANSWALIGGFWVVWPFLLEDMSLIITKKYFDGRWKFFLLKFGGILRTSEIWHDIKFIKVEKLQIAIWI